MNEREPIDWDRVRVDARYLGDCIFTHAGEDRDDPTLLLLVGVATAWLWRATPGSVERAQRDARCDLQTGQLGSHRIWCESPVTMKCICRRCRRECEASDRFHACADHEREVSEIHQRIRGVDARWKAILPAQNRTEVSQENASPADAEKKPFRERYAETLLSQADVALGRAEDERCLTAYRRLCWEVRVLAAMLDGIEISLESFFEITKAVRAVAALVERTGEGTNFL